MGVINLSDTQVLLCGGYDGSQYKNEVYKVTSDQYAITKCEKIESALPGNYIFIHNSFMRNQDLIYNYDLQLNLIHYNPKASGNQQFKVK
jgi:hypothetical protein